MKTLINRVMAFALMAGLLLATGCFYAGGGADFSEMIRLNWDIGIPEGYSVAYQRSNRGGFHGDGNTFTILEYPGALPDDIMDWTEPDSLRVRRHGSAADFAAYIYDDLNVLEELRYDPLQYDMLYLQENDDILLMFHKQGSNMLYVIEEYI